MRYSKQREEIKNFISVTKIHPTADDIYSYVRKTIPNISLGTVYRNLNVLVNNKEIRVIVIPGDNNRYDNNSINHYHIKCSSCSSIHDISNSYIENINKMIEKETNYLVTSHEIIFVGICPNCKERGK